MVASIWLFVLMAKLACGSLWPFLGALSELILLLRHQSRGEHGEHEGRNDAHARVGAIVCEGTIHPCGSNYHRYKRGHQEHLFFSHA
jgi:hypothetical protein